MLLRTDILAKQYNKTKNRFKYLSILFCEDTKENIEILRDAIQLAVLADEMNSFLKKLRIELADKINNDFDFEKGRYSGDYLLEETKELFNGYSFSSRLEKLKKEIHYLMNVLKRENSICKEKFNTNSKEMMVYAEHSIYGVFINKLFVFFIRLRNYGYDKEIMNVPLSLDYDKLFVTDEEKTFDEIFEMRDKDSVTISVTLANAVEEAERIKKHSNYLEKTIAIIDEKVDIKSYIQDTVQFLSDFAATTYIYDKEKASKYLVKLKEILYWVTAEYKSCDYLKMSLDSIRETEGGEMFTGKDSLFDFSFSDIYKEYLTAALYTEFMSFFDGRGYRCDLYESKIDDKNIYDICDSIIQLAIAESAQEELYDIIYSKEVLAAEILPIVKSSFSSIKGRIKDISFADIRDKLLSEADNNSENVD